MPRNPREWIERYAPGDVVAVLADDDPLSAMMQQHIAEGLFFRVSLPPGSVADYQWLMEEEVASVFDHYPAALLVLNASFGVAMSRPRGDVASHRRMRRYAVSHAGQISDRLNRGM